MTATIQECYGRVYLTDTQPDGLQRDIWVIRWDETNCPYLSMYSHETRPTRRHGWQRSTANAWFSSLLTEPTPGYLESSAVPLPIHLLGRFAETIRVE